MIPRVAAHRGYSARFPENTAEAFAAARMPGVVAVEFDVQLSRDGEPMVIHDQTLERIGQGPHRVAELDRDELQRLDAGSWMHPTHARARIPRLDEVLEILHDRELWIEIKVYPGDARSGRARQTVTCVERAVAQAQAEDRSRVLCFHRPTLLSTGLSRVLNLEHPTTGKSLQDLQAVDIDVETLTPSFADDVRRAGVGLLCYTVNTDAQLYRAMTCGVDAVISDDPAWALRACRAS